MGAKVLIIDDDPNIANLERIYLEKAGFQVSVTHTGLDAFAKLAGNGLPDLLIIDLRLPDMSGIDLMRRVKEMGKSIPSVIVTGAGDERVAVSAMKLGAMDYIIKDKDTIKHLPETCTEVLRKVSLAEENDKLTEELRLMNSELLEANRKLEELSRTDGLTGIYNRRTLLEFLDYECDKARRYGLPMSFGILDIDYFKAVNDTHGHPTGDAVLRQFACRVSGRLRRTDLIGRLGGEEFGIIFTGTSMGKAMFVCDELRRLVEADAFGDEGTPIRVTASAGVSTFVPEMSPDELVETADRGLYKAKKAGRNRVESVQQET